MTKTELKQKSQDELMYWMQNTFTVLSDTNADTELVDETRKQFRRVEKLFGYDPKSWSC